MLRKGKVNVVPYLVKNIVSRADPGL